MYRCEVCKVVSLPGAPRRTYNVLRTLPHTEYVGEQAIPSTRTEIIREIPVCGSCHASLSSGVPLPILVRQKGQAIVIPSTPRPGPYTPPGTPNRTEGNRPRSGGVQAMTLHPVQTPEPAPKVPQRVKVGRPTKGVTLQGLVPSKPAPKRKPRTKSQRKAAKPE